MPITTFVVSKAPFTPQMTELPTSPSGNPQTGGWSTNDVSILIGGLLILLSFCLLGLIVSAFFNSIKMMLVFGFSGVCVAILAGAEIMASCVATVIENVMDTILSRTKNVNHD